MKFLIAALLASVIFSSLAMGDDPATPECEISNQPLTENPLAGIAPTCLAERPQTRDAQAMFQNDQRVCNCIDRFPLATLLAQVSPEESVSEETVPEETISEEETVLPEVTAQMLYDQDPENIPSDKINQQCVSRVEFDSHMQMPLEEDFFTSIPATFNQSDWTMEGLISKYDSGTPAARAEAVARMTFLTRNPTLKGFLEATPTSNFPNAREKQNELFSLIRTLAPANGSRCSSTPHGCWEEMNRSGAYRRFRERLADLLDNEEVTKGLNEFMMTNGSSSIRADKEDERLGRPILNTPEDLYINTNAVEPQIFGCAGDSAVPECYQLFPAYCRKVRTVAERMARNQPLPGRSIMNRIDVRNSDDLSHEGFENFNNLVCNSPYQNAAGQSATFFQFRSQRCPAGQTTNSACADRKLLLTQFLSEFPNPDNDTTFPRTAFIRSLSSDPINLAVEARLYNANRIARISTDRFETKAGNFPAAISSARMQTLIGASNVSRASSGRTSSSSSSSSPGVVPPLRSSAGQSAAADSTRSGVTSRRSDFRESIPDPAFRPGSRRDFSSSTDDDDSFDEELPVRRRQPETSINNNQNRVQNPQPEDDTDPQQAQISQPTSSTDGQSRSAPSVSGGGRSTSGRGSTISSVAPETPQVSSSGGRRQLIEVTPRRGSGGGSSRSPASQDVSTSSGTDLRPVIPVEVNQALLTNALTDPQILLNDPGIMERVNSSAEEVVRIGLRVPGSNEDTVVYAIKESGGVRFSLVPPSETSPQNPAQILRPNEMNLRVVDQTSYSEISRDPQSLMANTELISTARTIEGGIVRMNIISPTGETKVIYLDKRTDQLRIITRLPR